MESLPMLLALLTACGPIALGGDDNSDSEATTLGSYEMGWPIDACSTELDDAGTGHAEGDVLPQYALKAQTGETVKLHDFCNHVVYLEFGYFT